MNRHIIRLSGMFACVAAVSTAAAGEDCTSRWNKLQDNQPAHATDVTDYIFNCANFIGNVGVGTTTLATWNSAYHVIDLAGYGVVYGSSYSAGWTGQSFGQSGWEQNTRYIDGISYSLGAGGASYLLQSAGQLEFGNAPSVNPGAVQTFSSRFDILPNGNVGIGTTSPAYTLDVAGIIRATNVSVSSDARLKSNITSLKNGALNRVVRLRPVTFEWKDPKGDEMKGTQTGLIAQEVEKILPSVVLTGKDTNRSKSIKYSELTAILIKAVQEQQNQIAAQRNQIATQQKQIAAMRIGCIELQARIAKLEVKKIANTH